MFFNICIGIYIAIMHVYVYVSSSYYRKESCMNLKTKLAIAEDVSWVEVSGEADKDIQAFNEAFAGDWDHDYDYYDDNDDNEGDMLMQERLDHYDDYHEYDDICECCGLM